MSAAAKQHAEKKRQRRRRNRQRAGGAGLLALIVLIVFVIFMPRTSPSSQTAGTMAYQTGPTYTPAAVATQISKFSDVTVTTTNDVCGILAGSGLDCQVAFVTVIQQIAAMGGCATNEIKLSAVVDPRVNRDWAEPHGWVEPSTGELVLNMFRLAEWTMQDVANGIPEFYQSRHQIDATEFNGIVKHETFHACGLRTDLGGTSFAIATNTELGMVTNATYMRGFAACNDLEGSTFCLKGLEEAAATIWDGEGGVYEDLESWMRYMMQLRGITPEQIAGWHHAKYGIKSFCNALLAKECEFFDMQALLQMPGSPRWDKLSTNEERLQLVFDNAEQVRGFYEPVMTPTALSN